MPALFSSQLLRRTRAVLLGCALGAAAAWAHADLWAYVDERGITHFSAQQGDDPRFTLYFRGADFDSSRPQEGLSTNLPGTARSGLGLAFFEKSPHFQRIQPSVQAAAERSEIDYELLQALIATESGFDIGAISPKGAVGLMQVMPATAERYGVSADAKRSVAQKLADPATNLRAGTRYLRYLQELFPGRLDLVLAAYNAGEGAVQRAGNQIPRFKETQNYVKTVLTLYGLLKPDAAAGSSGGHVRAASVATPARRSLPPPMPTGRVRMELAPPPATENAARASTVAPLQSGLGADVANWVRP